MSRFATALDEKRLIKWATRVTVASVRERADQETRRELDAVETAHESRFFKTWRSDRRLVLRRDSHRCTFPGCEAKAYLVMHHIKHWIRGGRTTYVNLATVCSFHHTAIHKLGWNVALENDQVVWFKPRGARYEPGPAPPEGPSARSRRDPHRLGQAAGYSRVFDLVKLL